MAKYYFPTAFIVLTLLPGCASLSNRQASSNTGSEQWDVYRFIGQASYSEVRQGDKQIEFIAGRLALNKTHLVMITGDSVSGVGGKELRIPIPDLEGAGLYLGDVTHSNQLQLKYKKSMLIVHVSGAQRTVENQRTQKLYDLLVSDGVPRLMTEQFYYVGMDLSERRDSSSSTASILNADAGVRFAKLIWDSIKTVGRFVIKPLSLL